MSTPKSCIGGAMMCLLIICLLWAIPAQAQDPAPENDANCISCHENRYYLYDTGKWYCLCEAPMHCVYCHGGRTDSYKQAIAHEGLVLYPTQEYAARCRTCHEQDYMSRIVKFESVAGIGSPLAVMPVEAGMFATAEPMGISAGQVYPLEPWRLVSLGLLGLTFVFLIFFALRCYRQDCAQHRL